MTKILCQSKEHNSCLGTDLSLKSLIMDRCKKCFYKQPIKVDFKSVTSVTPTHSVGVNQLFENVVKGVYS